MKKLLVGLALSFAVAASRPIAARAADPAKKDSGVVQAKGTAAGAVEPGGTAPRTEHLSGAIQSIGGGSIAIKNDKGLSASYPLSPEVSMFSASRKRLSVSDLRPGQRAALIVDSAGSVTHIFVSPAANEPANSSASKAGRTGRKGTDPKWGRKQTGDITSIDGNRITVEMAGQSVSATMDDGTIISSGTNRVGLSDLQVGDKVHMWASAGHATSIKIIETRGR